MSTDIQEFYEVTLLNTQKSCEQKLEEVNHMANKWEKSVSVQNSACPVEEVSLCMFFFVFITDPSFCQDLSGQIVRQTEEKAHPFEDNVMSRETQKRLINSSDQTRSHNRI